MSESGIDAAGLAVAPRPDPAPSRWGGAVVRTLAAFAWLVLSVGLLPLALGAWFVPVIGATVAAGLLVATVALVVAARRRAPRRAAYLVGACVTGWALLELVGTSVALWL